MGAVEMEEMRAMRARCRACDSRFQLIGWANNYDVPPSYEEMGRMMHLPDARVAYSRRRRP